MPKHEEYLRRNLKHASAIGAHAGAEHALARLAMMKRPPKWIVEAFEGIEKRTRDLPSELAKWRNEAPDAPQHARPK